MIDYSNNPEALRAISAIEDGDHLCLIGKAGTGKTTLVKHIKSLLGECNIATLAPTGIAAINAEGQTIHSLFHFAFRPLVPAKATAERRFLSMAEDETDKIRKIDLFIIDEISMVRADILDNIDQVLRLIHDAPLDPFGGVQLLMVGDPFQLPPVTPDKLFVRFVWRNWR